MKYNDKVYQQMKKPFLMFKNSLQAYSICKP